MEKSLWNDTFTLEVTQLKEQDRDKPFAMTVNAEKEQVNVPFTGSLKGAIRHGLEHYSQDFVVSISFYDSQGHWLKQIAF